MNPGGLRDELLYAGSTATNPANTDGTVTYAEANACCRSSTTSGWSSSPAGQLKAVLEQQWQPAGAQRPYLAPGPVRQRPRHPERQQARRQPDHRRAGQRRAARTTPRPTRSARSRFLGTGGDNFTAFKDGKAKDTGLVDRDLWIGYLKSAGTVAPDFARQQVEAKNMKTSIKPNKKYHFTVSGLDLTSLGSPQNTEVGVYAHRRGEEQA